MNQAGRDAAWDWSDAGDTGEKGGLQEWARVVRERSEA